MVTHELWVLVYAGPTPAAPTCGARTRLVTRVDCESAEAGSIPVGYPNLLVQPEAGGVFLPRSRQVRLLPRRLCLVMRLVSQAACPAVERGSIPLRGAEANASGTTSQERCLTTSRRLFGSEVMATKRIPTPQ